jgi:hypothetical protein
MNTSVRPPDSDAGGGMPRVRKALFNKGTGFTGEERAALGLDGLVPPRVE